MRRRVSCKLAEGALFHFGDDLRRPASALRASGAGTTAGRKPGAIAATRARRRAGCCFWRHHSERRSRQRPRRAGAALSSRQLLRIDAEYLRVTAIDSASNRLSVLRGVQGTVRCGAPARRKHRDLHGRRWRYATLTLRFAELMTKSAGLLERESTPCWSGCGA